MISIVPLQMEHVSMLMDPATEPGLLDVLLGSSNYWPKIVASGTAFSGFLDGRFLGCGGYAMPWPGVAEVWAWMLPEARERPLLTHGIVKRTLKHLERDKGIYRISCEVRAGNTRAVRWVEALGFKCEGIMYKRGPDGSDFYLYAKVKRNAA